MREDYREKKFLAAGALAKRESLALTHLVSWCEAGDLEARRIGDQWFVYLRDWEISGNQLINSLPRNTFPIASSSLILLATVFILIGMLNSKPFRTGSTLLATNVSNTAQMASVYDVLWIQLDHLWLKVDQITMTLASNSAYFWNQATEAWQGFLNRNVAISPSVNAPPDSALPLTLNPAALETLKNEIRAELLRDLKSSSAGNPATAPSTAPGLVVLPSSGDPTRDAALKLELKNSFSDQVEVKFDSSGQAGIITPIFPSGRGSNYLFILTPLKPSP